MKITFQYKCRKCGGIETQTRDGLTDDPVQSAVYRMMGAKEGCGLFGTTGPIFEQQIHICNAGSRGIADLIGFESAEE